MIKGWNKAFSGRIFFLSSEGDEDSRS